MRPAGGRSGRLPAKGISLFLLAGALFSCRPSSPPGPPAGEPARLDPSAIFALLDLLDAIAQKNPASAEGTATPAPPDRPTHRLGPEESARRNASDPEIREKMEAFLDTPAMKTYFRRFRNVTPEDYRRVFEALPTRKADAPGDIGTPLFELVSRRSETRAWVQFLASRVDVRHCRDLAARWLPEGDYPVPEVSLIFDNNAGSYAAEGKAFYNLYPGAFRSFAGGDGPGGQNPAEMEGVIAHELHHVFAEPYYERARPPEAPGARSSRNRVVEALVSEGAALHCNPPGGFRKELWEDPRTVGALVAELNGAFRRLSEGTLDEPAFQAWFSETFHRIPMGLLRDFVDRKFPEGEREAEVARYLSLRPDLVHALGWWMVSRISGEGARPEAVRELVRDPYLLLRRYDAALGEGGQSFRIDPRLIAE